MSAAEALFLALIALLPIMQPVIVEISRYQIPIADFVFVLAAAAAARDLAASRLSLPPLRSLRWLGAYGIAVTISAILSLDRAASFLKLAGDWYLIGIAALAMSHVRTRASLRRALTSWMAGTVVTVAAAAVGLAFFAVGVHDPGRNIVLSIKGSLPEGAYPRVMGLFLNPNMYCAYLTASLAFVFVMWRQQWLTTPAALALGAGIVGAAFVSLSPGFGGVVVVVTFVAWTTWRNTHRRLARAAVVLGAIGATAFLAAIMVSPPPNGPFSLATVRPSSRLLTWTGSLRAFPDHPVFGKGVGLPVVEIEYVNASGIVELLTDAHNTWLSILVQSGLVGLVAFTGLVLAALRGTGRTALTRTMAVAFAAGFLYQSVSGSFENTRHMWMLLGLLIASKDLPGDA